MSRKAAVPGVDRRQQILDAALEIFAEQGFEAATNRAIAERAGVNQGLIYFYFASKADVYFATSAYYTAQVIAQLGTVFAQAADEGSPVESLRSLLYGIMLILSTRPAIHLLRIMHQMVGSRAPLGELSNGEQRRTVSGLARYLTQRIREYLDVRIARAEFVESNSAEVAFMLTRTLFATITGSQGGVEQSDQAELAEMMARLYSYGLLPRAEQRSPE